MSEEAQMISVVNQFCAKNDVCFSVSQYPESYMQIGRLAWIFPETLSYLPVDQLSLTKKDNVTKIMVLQKLKVYHKLFSFILMVIAFSLVFSDLISKWFSERNIPSTDCNIILLVKRWRYL